MHDVSSKATVLVVFVVWLCIVPLVWGQTPGPITPQRKVVATIFPLYDLVRNVARPAVEVVLLVPPGASPHTFDAKPGTIRALQGSAAVFAIGHGLDDWVVRLAQGVGVTRTIVVDEQIPLRTGEHQTHGHRSARGHAHAHGAVDPHYWLAIPNAIRMVQTIATTLAQLDPADAAGYRQRAVAYQEQLQAVDQEIRQMLAGLQRRSMAVFHRAFDYFAAAYDLQVVAVFEPSPGREPAPRQVERFLRQVKAHGLRVVFIEPQLDAGPLRSVAPDLGVTVQELDPEGSSGTGRDSYIALMRFNAAQIATALRE
jgi:ABC-type Zn uptake system ZnuABC Zn-binding protein ZnuA